jgi:hypothetical protein
MDTRCALAVSSSVTIVWGRGKILFTPVILII